MFRPGFAGSEMKGCGIIDGCDVIYVCDFMKKLKSIQFNQRNENMNLEEVTKN